MDLPASPTDDPNADLQLTASTQACCDKTFVDEGKSGVPLRPVLQRCLKQLEHGDTLTVWKEVDSAAACDVV
jgi:DNA invertase Pin-like site-specific DNA recombinase